MSKQVSPFDRFVAKVRLGRPAFLDGEPIGECWQWIGSVNENGYGQFWVGGAKGKNWLAHRWSFRLFCGPLGDWFTVDHVCVNKRCVNPAHLILKSLKDNIALMFSRHTTCRNGHPRNAANIYIRPDGKGTDCRACRRDIDTQRRANKVIVEVHIDATSR